ncbi:KEOPS complex subunit Pcc1 [Methanomicrobium sp. W14]|uniref:KEOPS complex subunit Pcc1 n=1 Tax=Methanomicrobium sp. W14 TaxID=2817839 RepID=UPI001AEAA175|nr:KEOPS complex subunit Pcc1 [Methanomicrobium sp. W14]MBP2132463.1 KEOPS complex subunit Pcc1 [Methanomicrobium sp. W14]
MSSDLKRKDKAVFEFETPYAKQIYNSVKPEDDDMGRSSSGVFLTEKNTLVLCIDAEDLSALRAALNTWLRLIIIAEEMQEVIINE